MNQLQHNLDIYIATYRNLFDSAEGDNEFDTSLLQLMCLEKFANWIGYQRNSSGRFVNPTNKAATVVTLSNLVALYNSVVPSLPEESTGGLFVERVYLAGRSLNRCKILKHRVKFV